MRTGQPTSSADNSWAATPMCPRFPCLRSNCTLTSETSEARPTCSLLMDRPAAFTDHPMALRRLSYNEPAEPTRNESNLKRIPPLSVLCDQLPCKCRGLTQLPARPYWLPAPTPQPTPNMAERAPRVVESARKLDEPAPNSIDPAPKSAEAGAKKAPTSGRSSKTIALRTSGWLSRHLCRRRVQQIP